MIYTNGDSWTAGWPLSEKVGHREFSWPSLLSVKIGLPVVNDAKEAGSNYRMYRKTFDYLLLNQPSIAVIFLTHWKMFESGNITTGRIHQYLPQRDAERYGDYWHPYHFYSNFLRQIIGLQRLASTTGTEIFFLDTFSRNLNRNPDLEWFIKILRLAKAFDAMPDSQVRDQFEEIVELNKLVDYNLFISDRSAQAILLEKNELDRTIHPTVEGHISLTNLVYDAIVARK